MKRFTILGAALVAISGIATAFTTNKATTPADDKFDLTGTCVGLGGNSVTCREDDDITASCLTSGIENSANRNGTSDVQGECTNNDTPPLD